MVRGVLRRWLERERSIVVLFGTHCLWNAVILAWELTRPETPRYPSTGVWVLLFFLAWVCAVGYHARPESTAWWKWSGISLIAAYASRGVIVAVQSIHEGEMTPRYAIGIGVWTTFATAVALIWLRFLTPWRARA